MPDFSAPIPSRVRPADIRPHHEVITHAEKTKKIREPNPLLSSEGAALSQSSLTTGGLAENGGASLADDNGLGVGEYCGDCEASGALDIHEERSGAGDQSLSKTVSIFIGKKFMPSYLVSYLQLVLLGLGSRAGVQKINGENLGRVNVSIGALFSDARFKHLPSPGHIIHQEITPAVGIINSA